MKMSSNMPVRRQQRTPRTPRTPRTKKPEQLLNRGDTYSVGNKDVPDSPLIQKWSNEQKISTEIMKAEQTREYAEVIVRAYLPGGNFVDAIVHHDFETIKQIKLLEKLEKPKSQNAYFVKNEPPFNPDGSPNLTPNGMFKILKEMVRFKNFSIRDASTKAMRIAQYKALNKDWREQEEVISENLERKTVEDQINEKNQVKTRNEKEEWKPVKQDDGSEVHPPKRTKKTVNSRTYIEEEIEHLKKKDPLLKKALELLEEEDMELTKMNLLKKIDKIAHDPNYPEFNTDNFNKCKKDLRVKK